jgi:MinD-like ATPase involved in chromosome partitioning or flagellar assembly
MYLSALPDPKPVATPDSATPTETSSLETTISKRVIFTMGGKGGVGKTSFLLALAEWYARNDIPVTLLDLDTENKARGSLKHYFDGAARKVNIHTAAGLDSFVDHLEDGSPIVLADMGASSGQVTHEWFDTMYDDVAATGVAFTAIGVVTPDPASVESVLGWAARLQGRVDYLIVENSTTTHADFSYSRDSEQARQFRAVFDPIVLAMEFRLPELENPARQHGVTLSQVAERKIELPELQRASVVIRALSYRRRLFAEIERAKHLLLP